MTKTLKEKDLQTELRQSAHKVWLAGLGAVATAEEEGTRLFQTLVAKGETFEARGRKQLDRVMKAVETVRDKAGERFHQVGEDFDEKVSATIERLGVPSRGEIQKLTRRVEELNRKIEPVLAAKAAPLSTKATKTA